MSLWHLIIGIVAIVGIIWAYPKIPYPWNYVLVGVVVVLCLWVLFGLAGVGTGLRIN